MGITPFNPRMLAYCGIYCQQCSFKIAAQTGDLQHLQALPFEVPFDLTAPACESCKGKSICGPCAIRDCASSKAFQSCADCPDFPCDHTRIYDNPAMLHHRQAIENLQHIRAIGPEKWFEELNKNLRCPCGNPKTWYYSCPNH